MGHVDLQQQWTELIGGGAKSCLAELVLIRGAGRGLRATQDISGGQVILILICSNSIHEQS